MNRNIILLIAILVISMPMLLSIIINNNTVYPIGSVIKNYNISPADSAIKNNNICECNSCNDCMEVLNSSNCPTVHLINSIRSATTCIDNPKGFSDKIFDCSGNTISGHTGKDAISKNGIELYSKENVIIKNCIVKGFGNGIVINNVYNISIYNSSFINNDIGKNNNCGIYAISMEKLKVKNTVLSNNAYAIMISSSLDITLENLYAENITTGDCYAFHKSVDNIFADNISCHDFEDYGLWINHIDNVTVSNSFFNGTETPDDSDGFGGGGAWIEGSSNVRIIDSVFQNNNPVSTGIEIITSNNVDIINNIIRESGSYGLYIDGDVGEINISNNIICTESNNYDIYSRGIYQGYNNTCDLTYNWSDRGTIGCNLPCEE